MKSYSFKITDSQLEKILFANSNMGKNSHVGNVAVEIVKLYYQSLDSNAKFGKGKKGSDIEVSYLGKTEYFEIKGTNDKIFTWTKLKVSSQACHDALVSGMELIRVTGVGTNNPSLHFLKHGEDFLLAAEPRWTLKKSKL